MKKSLIISSMAAFAALCTCLTAQAQGPMVVSDKDDYAPGETAMFSATGFQPGEMLDFSVAMSDDNGLWVPDIDWADIEADASGGAEVDYVVPDTWANKTLQLTVMGLSSSLIATTTFTDAPPCTVSYTTSAWSISHDASNNISVSVNVVFVESCGRTLTAVTAQVANLGQIVLTNQGGGTWSGSAQGACGTIYTFNHIQTTAHSDTDNPADKQDTINSPNPNPTTTTDPCPTPSPSASPSATPCQNIAPEISCTGNGAELGKVVGCLGDDGFSQTFDVSWAVVAAPSSAPANEKIVQATFTKPNCTMDCTVTVDVANVTDTDGDDIDVDLLNETTLVTISGPGPGSAGFSVDIHADDGQDCNNTDDATCDEGEANAEIAFHVAYLPPLAGQINCKVKQGSAVPVKMQLSDSCGHSITPDTFPGYTPSIDVVKYMTGASVWGDPIVDNAGNSGDTCNTVCYFRWEPTDLFWIFNLKTNTSYHVGCTYEIWPSNVDQSAKINIK